MNLIGKGHLFNKKIRTPDEVETSINNIKKSEIEALMFKILSSKPSIALVGRVDQKLLDVCTSIIGG